jgi:hypothetical protein
MSKLGLLSETYLRGEEGGVKFGLVRAEVIDVRSGDMDG